MRLILPLLSAVVLCLAPCVRPDSQVKVAASIYPITMLIREIGGDPVEIATIVPPGADPHHFELTPTKVMAILRAQVVFLIGGDFDAWVMSNNREATAKQVLVEFRESLRDSLIELGETFNPHFWLDPLLAVEMGKVIAATLARIDPHRLSYYEERTAEFVARMELLHKSTALRLARSGFNDFASFHPAWTYFARRYGLNEVGVIEQFPEYEPSAKKIAALITGMKRSEVAFILVERASDIHLVKGVAKDTGARIVVLDPLGRSDTAGRRTYFELMDYNISVIETASSGH